MGNDVQLHLVAMEAASAVEAEPGDIVAKLKTAMRKAKNHWMVLDEDTQFRGAIGAVMIHYGTDSAEYERLAWEVGRMRQFSAFLQAAQAGLSVDVPEADQRFEPLGLMNLWHEIKAEQ